MPWSDCAGGPWVKWGTFLPARPSSVTGSTLEHESGAGAARPARQSADRCRAGSTGDPTRTAGNKPAAARPLRGERPTLDLTEDLLRVNAALGRGHLADRVGVDRALVHGELEDAQRQRSALGHCGWPHAAVEVGLPAAPPVAFRSRGEDLRLWLLTSAPCADSEEAFGDPQQPCDPYGERPAAESA